MAKKKPKYLEQSHGSGEKLSNVNARVPQSLHDDFNKCVEFAQQNGMKLSITNVIKTAMQEAINEVRALPEAQGKLDL